MRRDIGLGLGLLVFCGFMYWQAGLAPANPFVPYGPAFYPRVILLVLAGLAVWMIWEAWAQKRKAAAAAPGVSQVPDYRRVMLGFAIFLGYVGALSILGFLAATFLFVLSLSWAIGPRRMAELPKLVALAVGTTAGTFLLFEKYLHVFLPRGWLF
ncbi:MAG: tripartite tricarboxylate transporter TctB family protein [Candidatus Methylomirabilota bacterium]